MRRRRGAGRAHRPPIPASRRRAAPTIGGGGVGLARCRETAGRHRSSSRRQGLEATAWECRLQTGATARDGAVASHRRLWVMARLTRSTVIRHPGLAGPGRCRLITKRVAADHHRHTATAPRRHTVTAHRPPATGRRRRVHRSTWATGRRPLATGRHPRDTAHRTGHRPAARQVTGRRRRWHPRGCRRRVRPGRRALACRRQWVGRQGCLRRATARPSPTVTACRLRATGRRPWACPRQG
mmetsp:Transcript_103245/g.318558  ORF Transcript_103245/g.318558 Transcript_103245/m.318558 type:complete len:240 (-) Transcript_103245:640-1359(-)